MKKSTKTIRQLLPDFLDYLEIEKGLSQRTQINYRRYLDKFFVWLETVKKPTMKPSELTADEIWNYRLFLARDPRSGTLSRITQNYYLIALRSLLNYFAEKDISSISSKKISLAKDARSSQNIKFLNLEQIERLLLTPDINTQNGLRDRAILETLFSTGLRVAELASLNKDAIPANENRKSAELAVKGKGGRVRTIYISERCLDWLRRYLHNRTDMDRALFVHYRSRTDTPSMRLTIRSIERIVKNCAVAAGIPTFTSPHTLRHSYATDLLTQGVDLRVVQEFLGHKNISTTQIYTHVTNKQLRDIHKKFHSGDRIKNS